MKYVTFFCRLSTVVAFFFCSCIVVAQPNTNPEMEKLFSDNQEHASYMLHYNNTGSDYYQVENDSLFSCSLISGLKIALADVDFSKTVIVKSSNYLVKGTSNPVYVLKVVPLTGKPCLSYGCFMGKYSFSSSASAHFDKTVNLDMDSKQTAEKAVAYLQQLVNSKKGNNTVTGDFDTDLMNLINGLKDNFESLKGALTGEDSDDKRWISKKQLSGAVSTKVGMGELNNMYLLAGFGEFNTLSAASKAYYNVEKKIAAWKKGGLSLVKQKGNENEVITTQSWVPLDLDGSLDASIEDFSVTVEMIKTMKLDNDLKKVDVFIVSLTIEKQ